MRLVRAPQDGFTCDVCRKLLAKGDEMLSCHAATYDRAGGRLGTPSRQICNSDVCNACVQKAKQQHAGDEADNEGEPVPTVFDWPLDLKSGHFICGRCPALTLLDQTIRVDVSR